MTPGAGSGGGVTLDTVKVRPQVQVQGGGVSLDTVDI